MRRLRSTGLAAMVTIYGPRSAAEAMIARVWRIHDAVAGTTPAGEAYCANDPELLNWVHATAAYGFLRAYHAYVQPLPLSERDHYYAEGALVAHLYGASTTPASEAQLKMLFRAMAGRLERSDIVFEFLAIMRSAPILLLLLRPMQHLLVRAAVDLTPHWARTILGLNGQGLRPWEAEPVRKQPLSQIASFWNPIRPFRRVCACSFRPIICMSNAAQARSAPVQSQPVTRDNPMLLAYGAMPVYLYGAPSEEEPDVATDIKISSGDATLIQDISQHDSIVAYLYSTASLR